MIEGTLILSENAGRYTIDDGEESRELSTGMRIEVYAGRLVWIAGTVQHAGRLYAIPGSAMRKRGDPPPAVGGCYLLTDAGESIGICAGMTVRIP